MRLTDVLDPPTSYKIQSWFPLSEGGQARRRASVEGGTRTHRDAEVILLDADSPKPCLDYVLI